MEELDRSDWLDALNRELQAHPKFQDGWCFIWAPKGVSADQATGTAYFPENAFPVTAEVKKNFERKFRPRPVL